MNARRTDIAAGLFFMVLSLGYFIAATTIKKLNFFGGSQVDSQTIPKLLGLLLFALGAIQVLSNLKKKDSAVENKIAVPDPCRSAPDAEGPRDFRAEAIAAEKAEEAAPIDRWAILLTLGFLIVYAALIVPLGFPLATCLYLLAQIILLTRDSKRRKQMPLIVLLSVVFSVGIYLLFAKGLKLVLPAGLLF